MVFLAFNDSALTGVRPYSAQLFEIAEQIPGARGRILALQSHGLPPTYLHAIDALSGFAITKQQ